MKTVLNGWDFSAAGVHLNTLDTMHREKHGIESNIISGLDQPDKVFERIQVYTTQTNARRIDGNHCAPVFFPRIVQSHQNNGVFSKRLHRGCLGGSGRLLMFSLEYEIGIRGQLLNASLGRLSAQLVANASAVTRRSEPNAGLLSAR